MKKVVDKINKLFEEKYSSKLTNIAFIREILFFVGFTGVLFVSSCSYSSMLKISYQAQSIINNFSLALLVAKIIITKEKLSKCIFIIVTLVFAYVCDVSTGMRYSTFMIVATIFACRGIDIKKAINYMLIFNMIFIMCHILAYVLSCIGLLNLGTKENIELYRNNHLRYSFYFYHPNTFSNYLFWTYMMYVYLNFNNKENYKYIVIAAAFFAYVVYLFPVSRNATLFFIMSVVLLYLFNNKKIKKMLNFHDLLKYSFVGLLFLSFILVIIFNFNNNGFIISYINKALSNRILIGSRFLQEYGISLYGTLMTNARNYSAIGVPRVILDNWYYYLIIRIGLILTSFFGYGITKTLSKALEKKDYSKIYVLIIFLSYNLIECVAINMSTAFPLIFLSLFI